MYKTQQMHLLDLGRAINMKQYTVKITNQVLEDMELLYNYIVNTLLSPENAIRQYNRIADGYSSLILFQSVSVL